MEAILLAGGMGTRLRSVVDDRPKVMADVGGKPFLAHLVDRLAAQGVRHVVLAVGYLREQVMAHFGDAFETPAGAVAITYSIEEDPLGTGGAIRRAIGATRGDASFVLNGDTWLELDLPAMDAACRAADAPFGMAVRHLDDVARFGALVVEGERVTGFIEKGRSGPGWINAGVYRLRRGLLSDGSLPERFSFENDFLMPRVASLRPLAFATDGAFIDIGVPEDYARAQRLFDRA